MRGNTQQAPIFSWKTGLIALLVGVISFASLIVLSAYAPDLQDRNTAGLHAYSRSALGYNFAVELLQKLGYDASINRDAHQLTDPYAWEILVVTPESAFDAEALEELETDREGPLLVVLPKRYGWPSAQNPRHQGFTDKTKPENISKLITPFGDDFELERITPVSRVNFFGERYKTHFEDDTQIISAGPIEPIVGVTDGTIFGRVLNTEVYILSDPELMNTHGLAHIENAKLMVAMFEELTDYDKSYTILFDTTLHGFERSRNLMKLLFQPPFLGATLFMLAASVLLGWAAFVRFGAAPRPEPQFSTGRVTLIDSTNGLFELAERQPSLAGDYGDVMRRLSISELGYPDDLSHLQISEILDQTETRLVSKGQQRPERPSAANVQSAGQLLSFARAYYQWKKDLSDGRE